MLATPIEKETPPMKHVRKVAAVAVACALSFGVLGISAPAHAKDFSWGFAKPSNVKVK